MYQSKVQQYLSQAPFLKKTHHDVHYFREKINHPQNLSKNIWGTLMQKRSKPNPKVDLDPKITILWNHTHVLSFLVPASLFRRYWLFPENDLFSENITPNLLKGLLVQPLSWLFGNLQCSDPAKGSKKLRIKKKPIQIAFVNTSRQIRVQMQNLFMSSILMLAISWGNSLTSTK